MALESNSTTGPVTPASCRCHFDQIDCKLRTLGFLSSIVICDLPTISMASLLDPNVANASSALAKVHGARCHCRPPAVGKATWRGTARRQAVRPMIQGQTHGGIPNLKKYLEVWNLIQRGVQHLLIYMHVHFFTIYCFFLQIRSEDCWCFEMTINDCHDCHGSYVTIMCSLPNI